MKRIFRKLPIKNIVKSPVRTIGLVLLAAFLSFSICAGTIVITSLRRGMEALEARLGADIIVVPEESYETLDIEGILLEGTNGYFYMDREKTDEIKAIAGIGEISEQLFLTSLSSGCCSFPVQIVGYDPDTDFTITPWISQSESQYPKTLEVVAGNDLHVEVGDTLTFYDVEVRVAARLDKTGTSLDSSVYASTDTLKALIQSSIDKKLNLFDDLKVDNIVSCVLINAADGVNISDVLKKINMDVDGVKAIRTKAMISGLETNLSGMSKIIISLVAVIWILAFMIMVIAFIITSNSRKKEFATLRIIGVTRRKLAGIVISEGIVLSILGNILGILLSLLVIIPFSNLIKSMLSLPYLLPDAGKITIIAVVALGLSIISGIISTLISAYRISRIDTALILREGF